MGLNRLDAPLTALVVVALASCGGTTGTGAAKASPSPSRTHTAAAATAASASASPDPWLSWCFGKGFTDLRDVIGAPGNL